MARGETKLTGEFASTMQQLVAEAEKSFPTSSDVKGSAAGTPSEIIGGFANLEERIAGLEKTLAASLDELTSALPSTPPDHAPQLQRIDEHLIALRNTESVNHRLFNSLHQELKDYRDNFLRDTLQKPFIRDLIVLFDDLSSLASQLQSASASGESRVGVVAQWCENLDNSIHAILEIMHRMEVNEIEPKDVVDRAFHKVVSYEPADFAEEDGHIIVRLKRGFLWRNQVLRPEEVIAKRFE